MRGVGKVESCYGVATNAFVSNPVVHGEGGFKADIVETLKP